MKVLSVASTFSKQPEDRLISVSRVKDATCPYRYFKNYVEVPRQEPPFKSIEVGIGELFHAHLESKFKKVKAQNRRVRASDVVDIAELRRLFRMSMVSRGSLKEPYRIVRQADTTGDYEERLVQVATNFNRFLRDTLTGHKVIGVEGNLQIQTSACYIRGIYDLVTEDPDGVLALWDWKTGAPPKPRYVEDCLAQKGQLGAYTIWMRYKYAQSDIQGTAVFLGEGLQAVSETFTLAMERAVLGYFIQWRRQLNALNETKSYPRIRDNLCPWCAWNEVCRQADRDDATAWARDVLQRGKEYVILDLETTGLGDADEMVQIAVVDMRGNVLMSELVRPTKAKISPKAQAVHRISMAMLRGRPRFKDLAVKIRRAIADKNIITYNADFDKRLYTQTHHVAGGFMPKGRWECAMRQYAQYVSEWDPRRGGYKWPKLQGGDHTAAGDCLAALDVIREIAGMAKTS